MKPSNPSRFWTVYMVRCADRTIYTGIAKDLGRRVAEHNSGSGAKYTRGRAPVELVFAEDLNSHGEALRREYEIKQMSRARKLRLIEGFIAKG
ncbi:MAG: GIY-YIG nuclease family protein [Candidatus Thiodiazotropha sp.]|nr:GIY-YIG nuclease family protein [Candidatus Thiodiazotropha taylori]MBT3059909.1 GIY-YIG nuclease family protein [Candidatus Thiodiazotropha sp. (ex Lucina pensylvanica)]MBV2095550.1 GIY-YIG nuclease family protein [Candidatus Thiodiazotropha sp. (ex Codakia orbicularis)]PUB72673.1 MAG: endonuclease [gamma proteobacterium symbiont of Ctena orbiculata]MBT3064987.1 GIY-YIG nuclease family protein [Candidatus Thiodiazotropha sp. (ex Lucina pensylvanica)]